MRHTEAHKRWEDAVNRALWKTSVSALFVLATAVASVHAQPAPADVILTNGKIITVDNRFSIAQAVAVRGDRIVAVGTSAGYQSSRRTQHAAHRSRGARPLFPA